MHILAMSGARAALCVPQWPMARIVKRGATHILAATQHTAVQGAPSANQIAAAAAAARMVPQQRVPART